MAGAVMGVDRRIVTKSANKAMIGRVRAKNIVDLALTEIVISLIQGIGGPEDIGIDQRNESSIRCVAKRAESVDEHQAPGGPCASADRPEVLPSLCVGLELGLAGKLCHKHINTEMLVVPVLGPVEARNAALIVAHRRIELAGSGQERGITGRAE